MNSNFGTVETVSELSQNPNKSGKTKNRVKRRLKQQLEDPGTDSK